MPTSGHHQIVRIPMTRLILLVLLLCSACRTKRQSEVQSHSELQHAHSTLSWDSLLVRQVRLDSLALSIERYDTIGRLRERLTATQTSRAVASATRHQYTQKSDTTQQRTTTRQSFTHKSRPAVLPTAWWLWVGIGLVVGIFVSIRFLKYRN